MAQTAVDHLVSKMCANDMGIPESSTLILVDSHWLELGEWNPQLLAQDFEVGVV